MQSRNLLCTVTAQALLVVALLHPELPGHAAVPGDEHWDNQFGPVGVNEAASSVASWRGQIYVGGFHSAAGNTKASAIARFDGTNWAGLDQGILGEQNLTYVYALEQDTNYLYVGGWFTNADISGARYVARWDGVAWSAMGSGLTGPVFALRRVGTNLYAGGIFPTDSTNFTYNCLARWTGQQWERIGGEFSGSFPTVGAIETDGTNLIVGGKFTGAGGVTATNVAMWNGSAWSALGPSINGSVLTLLYHKGRLRAGGIFTNSTAGYTNIAEWNGSAWVPWFNPNRAVRDLVSDGTNVYVGGDFTGISGQAFNRIARWDGTNWFPLSTGVQGAGVAAIPGVYKMALGPNGRLYAAGNFNIMGGVGASHVAGWNGSAWFGLGGTTSKGLTHFIGFVSSFLARGTDLYVGGLFT